MCKYISITFIAISITNKWLLKITLSMMTKYRDFDITLFVQLNKETTISTRINSYYSNNRAPLYIHYIISIIFFKRKVKLQINALYEKEIQHNCSRAWEEIYMKPQQYVKYQTCYSLNLHNTVYKLKKMFLSCDFKCQRL